MGCPTVTSNSPGTTAGAGRLPAFFPHQCCGDPLDSCGPAPQSVRRIKFPIAAERPVVTGIRHPRRCVGSDGRITPGSLGMAMMPKLEATWEKLTGALSEVLRIHPTGVEPPVGRPGNSGQFVSRRSGRRRIRRTRPAGRVRRLPHSRSAGAAGGAADEVGGAGVNTHTGWRGRTDVAHAPRPRGPTPPRPGQ